MLVGGKKVENVSGRFYEPTLLVDVDHTMKIMTEETFGPTLPIMKVADADEGVRLANESPYGLGASVFTRDVERGELVARRLEAGAANVNDALVNYTALELPMGGAKASGIGSRHGAGRHPQVLLPAGDRDHAEARAQARGAHVPLQGPHHAHDLAPVQVAVRPRKT